MLSYCLFVSLHVCFFSSIHRQYDCIYFKRETLLILNNIEVNRLNVSISGHSGSKT